MLDTDIITETGVNKKVLIDFYDDLRILCQKYFEEHPIRLGGDGIIVQADESMFRYKPKYNGGRATDQEVWVFGLADVSFAPAMVYLQVVQNRTAEVLIPIITQEAGLVQ